MHQFCLAVYTTTRGLIDSWHDVQTIHIIFVRQHAMIHITSLETVHYRSNCGMSIIHFLIPFLNFNPAANKSKGSAALGLGFGGAVEAATGAGAGALGS